MREFIKKYGISMGLVCLVPIILLLPNLPYFNTHLIGALGSDAPKHVWGQWWIHRALMLHGEIPFELDITNYPDGGRFFCLDTANGIFSVPLRVLFHPVLTFNLLILVHLMAAGLSAWYLCLQLVKDHRAAMVAGAAFSCAPFVMSHGLASGVSEGIFLFPLPLIILCMFRMATRTSWKYPICAALLLVVQGLGSWHYGVLAGVMTVVCGAIAILSRFRHPKWLIEEGLAPGLLKRVLVFVCLLLPLVAVLFSQVQGTVEGDAAVYQRGLSIFPDGLPKPELVEQQLKDPFFSQGNIPWPAENVLSFVDPILPTSAGLHVDSQSIDVLLATGYTGFVWIGLGLFGGRRGRFFVFLAALFHALAMGARVFWDPKFEMGGFRNPIYTLFYLAFPLFHETRHVNERFAMGTALCIGIAAAFGVKRLQKKTRWAPALALAVFLTESIVLSPAPWPVPHSDAGLHVLTKELAKADGAIIDMPRQYKGERTFVGDILVQQMYHQKPIPYSMDEKPNPRPVIIQNRHVNPAYLASETVAENFFYRYLLAIVRGGEDLQTCQGVSELRALGFSAILFREDAVDPDHLMVTRRVLKRCMSAGTRADGRQIFWFPDMENQPQGLY